MSVLLSVQNLKKAHGEKLLFDGASFGIQERDRIGLIGINGSGKSTLLKIIAGEEPCDGGSITKRQDLRVEYLSQNPTFPDGQSAGDWVLEGSGAVGKLVVRYERLLQEIEAHPEDEAKQERFTKIQSEMEEAGAWQFEAEVRGVLGRLGIHDISSPIESLSGGYRKRLSLAKALLSNADLLILDEPTNHLDADTIAWLEGYLARFPGAVALVTHDRYFLDRVTNRIGEIDLGGIQWYEGNFGYYLRKKAEREANAAKQEDRRLNILRNELKWLQRGPKARATKAQARIDRISDLQETSHAIKRESMTFDVQTRRLGKKAIEVNGVSKSFDGEPVLEDLTYIITPGERLGVIGPNGSGKSTFANILVGRLEPDSGTVSIGETVSFGYNDQESAALDPSMRAIDYVKQEGGEMLGGSDGSFLSAELMMERFLFPPKLQYSPIEVLSGGERRRLQLVCTLMRDPNFLILDEPTNDLDIPTLQALEDFLQSFDACLMVVSHDRYFLDRTIDHLLVFEKGKSPRLFPGNYSAWAEARQQAEAEKKQTASAQKTKKAPPKETEKPKAKKLSYKEQREFDSLDEGIPGLEEEIAKVEAQMAEAASDFEKMRSLSEQHQKLSRELERSMERWEELAERA